MEMNYSVADFGEQAYEKSVQQCLKDVNGFKKAYERVTAKTKEARKASTNAEIEVGQEINHKVFGMGTVESIVDGIAIVNFDGNVKKLMLEVLGGAFK